MKTRKINTRPDKSVMDCVKEFIAAGFTTFVVDDVCKLYPERPKSQIATALWKLRNAGTVSKDDVTGVYTVLTGVNAPAPKAEPKAAAFETVSKERYDKLVERWTTLYGEHEDALAIIRYLENKLYVALQQVAKHG